MSMDRPTSGSLRSLHDPMDGHGQSGRATVFPLGPSWNGMVDARLLDAYCTVCGDTRAHLLAEDDPGSCYCRVCGKAQPLMVPFRS